jgi:flagellar export protein FliJ
MAARFRFRLEALLKLRKALEEEAQRNLARAIQRRQDAENRLRALEHEQERAVEGRRSRVGETIDMDHLKATERFLVVLERNLLQTRRDLAEADGRVAECRKALQRAHQAHLTLLRLKERRHEQHELEQLHEEIRAADEIAVLRYRFTPRSETAPLREVSP